MAVVVAPTGCGDGRSTPDATPSSTTSGTSGPTTSVPTTTVSVPAPTTVPPTTTTAVPAFEGTAVEIPPEVRSRMDGVSMRPGCPVGYDGLRYLRLSHWTMDGVVATGELVVAAEHADAVVGVFRRLFDARFPIRRMTLVDDFGLAADPRDGADDFASIEADNTSAFNCREAFGNDNWSEHAFGRAIDINPIENPYVFRDGTTDHPASVPYLDRTLGAPGMITDGDVVVRAFADIGWGWGGTWSGIKDYQHVSASGR